MSLLNFLIWYLPPDLLYSLSVAPSYLNTRLVAFCCLTSIFLIHGTLLPWGVRLQNTLGAFKSIVLALICLTGILCLTGMGGLKVRDGYEKPNNFEWETFWEGSQGKGANAFFSGLYNVIWQVTWKFLISVPRLKFKLKVIHRLFERQLCTFWNTRSRSHS